jgi:hypothetical protein
MTLLIFQLLSLFLKLQLPFLSNPSNNKNNNNIIINKENNNNNTLIAHQTKGIWTFYSNLSSDHWHISSKHFSSQYNHHSCCYNDKKRLMNKKIIFIGDSLMRYQYISLVNYLHYNTWNNNNYKPRPEVEYDWANWTEFFAGTSLRLGNNNNNYYYNYYNYYYYFIIIIRLSRVM